MVRGCRQAKRVIERIILDTTRSKEVLMMEITGYTPAVGQLNPIGMKTNYI